MSRSPSRKAHAMEDRSFQETVEDWVARDSRYAAEAYYFLREGLDFTVKALQANRNGQTRHVSGKELCDGLREYAVREYGPMTFTVLNAWGLHATSDFGEIVFHLVESGKLGTNKNDRREDFYDCYDFAEAFAEPYEVPVIPRRLRRPRSRGRG